MLVHQIIHLVVQTFDDVISHRACVEFLLLNLETIYFDISFEVPSYHEQQARLQVFCYDL